MLLISSDFRVCWQMVKKKPENFEKKTEKKYLRKKSSYDNKKLHMSANMCCIVNIIVVHKSVRQTRAK